MQCRPKGVKQVFPIFFIELASPPLPPFVGDPVEIVTKGVSIDCRQDRPDLIVLKHLTWTEYPGFFYA
jgi:hypothetical protein